MDKFMIKAIELKMSEIKELKNIGGRNLSYMYADVPMYSKIPELRHKEDIVACIKAIIKKEIASYELLQVCWSVTGHMVYIEEAIRKKEHKLIEEKLANSPTYIESVIRQMLDKMHQENKKKGITFKQAYMGCIEGFKENILERMREDEINKERNMQELMKTELQVKNLQKETIAKQLPKIDEEGI